jgi:catechol 2,3-dioxygenase-like lactoylglutathione lyase family enzyme
MIRVDHIDHVAIAVRDPTASADWYRDILGLDRRWADVWEGPPVMMCAGETCVALFPIEGDSVPAPAATIRHLAFKLDRENFERAQTLLTERGISWRFADHDVAHSIYFSDPDGYTIELSTYELKSL